MKLQPDALKWLQLATRAMSKAVYNAEVSASDIVKDQRIDWATLARLHSAYKQQPPETVETPKLPDEITEAIRHLDHLYVEAYMGMAHELSRQLHARALLLIRHQMTDLVQLKYLAHYWKATAEKCAVAYYELLREQMLTPQAA